MYAKCIVVEDDPFWSAEITSTLTNQDVSVIAVDTGAEAVRMARLHPDAGMVLDIILPDFDGIEVLGQLKQFAPDMPVLAVSGGGRLGPAFYLKLAKKFGARDRLAKPFAASQLSECWNRMAT